MTDKVDLTPSAGESDDRSARIVLRDNNMDRRLDPSGSSTPAPGFKDDVTRRCILLQLMNPMLMILTAIHGGNTSNVSDEGVATGGSPDTPSEHVPGDDHVGNDAHDAVQRARSEGKRAHPGNVLSSLTTSTYRKRLERQGNWRSCARI